MSNKKRKSETENVPLLHLNVTLDLQDAEVLAVIDKLMARATEILDCCSPASDVRRLEDLEAFYKCLNELVSTLGRAASICSCVLRHSIGTHVRASETRKRRIAQLTD